MTDGRNILGRKHTAYIRTQMGSANPTQVKKALQELCECYRRRQVVLAEYLRGIEDQINGLLFTSNDSKVRRWALNALAQLGSSASERAITQSLELYKDDPDVVAAAIAALHHVVPTTAGRTLAKTGLHPQMTALAALQHVAPAKLDLKSLPLHLDTAPPNLIRLGLVVVGLDKAPPNLFDPHYENAELVKQLGGHHDPSISQYSIWAINENDRLNINHLGVPLSSIETYPPNIRGWIYQLAASTAETAPQYLEYIDLGIAETDAEARAGVALGLKDAYSVEIEKRVVDWVFKEVDAEIKRHLHGHIIQYAGRSLQYTKIAVELYKAEQNYRLRDNMLEKAFQTPLFMAFKQTELNGGLFGGVVMNQTTFNIGSMQNNGATAFNGDATNNGGNYNVEATQKIMQMLDAAEREIKASPHTDAEKKPALEAIAAAKKTPEKGFLEKAVSTMKSFAALANAAAGSGTAVHKAIAALHTLAGGG